MENSVDGRCTEPTGSHRGIQSVATVIIDQTSTHGAFFTRRTMFCNQRWKRNIHVAPAHGVQEERMAFKKEVLNELLAVPDGKDVFGKTGYSKSVGRANVECGGDLSSDAGAAEPGVFSDSAESQSSSRSLFVAFS